MIASEAYYYLFSLATFISILVYVTNNISYRLWNKTFLGVTYAKGTVEYKVMKKWISRPYIAIAVSVLILSLLNLVYATNNLLQVQDKLAARNVLIIFTTLVLFITCGVIIFAKTTHGKNNK